MPDISILSTRNTTRYGQSIKNVPLRERYEAQVAAPDLISLRDELALIDGRLSQLLGKLEGEGVDFYGLYDAFHELATYIALDDEQGIKVAMGDMSEIIQKGIAETLIWKEVYPVIEQRRRLVETEMKTLNTIGAMLSTQQLMLIIGKLMASLSLHITNLDGGKDAVAAVRNDLTRILDLVPIGSKGFHTVDSE